jgi:hypothetical protein
MRKLILISALLLASVSAQAGDSRSLVLAANDTPAATDAQPVAPAPVPATTTDAAKPQAADTAPQAAEPAKPHASRQAKTGRAGRHEGDEAKARRIAAKYGVYW